ncbi:hypothetical protein BDV18DRAFT_158366 [Aspergillus unguis]
MGKLTYAARKIDGIRAAQAVAKDLKKRFPPGLHAKAAARDPTLEIDLTGKALTDEGFAEFIDDLIKCVRFRDEQHPFGLAKVTELHLKGNKLTVRSLAKLGEVIADNTGDLRELDLSKNEINIVTEEEQDIWWKFLRSFKNCYVLQKLDLSENVIGVAGVEIFTRVYMKSDLEHLESDAAVIVEKDHGVDPNKGKDVKTSLSEQVGALNLDKENADPHVGSYKASPAKGKSKQNGTTSTGAEPKKKDDSFDKLRKYACTRGLRSIAYLVLSNIELTNTSVGHLNRMVATQRASKKLLAYLPPVKSSNVPEAAEANKSIIWKPNNTLNIRATSLLQITESIREIQEKAQAKFVSVDKVAGEAPDREENDDDSSSEEEEEDEEIIQKRRAHLFLAHTRLLKRVRIEALKEEGIGANQIALTALKMGLLARFLLLEDKDRAKEETDSNEDETLPSEDSEPEESMFANQEDEQGEEFEQAQEDEVNELNIEEPASPEQSHVTPGAYYHPVVTGPFHPSADRFDLEFPALKAIRPKPEPKMEPCQTKTEEDKTSEKSTLASNTEPGTDSDDDREANKNGNGTSITRSSGKGTTRGGNGKEKKNSWRFGLGIENWCSIIAHLVGAHGVLDLEQQMRIVYYASDWDALAYELTIQGAEDSQQIWKYLDTVDCFTYTPLL